MLTGLCAGGTPPGRAQDSGNAADASYLGNFELYSTGSTGSSTWSPGSLTMPSAGLMVVIYTGRNANGASGVALNSISLGGSTATLYKLNEHTSNIDKYYIACRQVSSGSNAVSVTYSGTLDGTTGSIHQVVSGWYVSGQTSDIPRTANADIATTAGQSITNSSVWGKSVSIFQYWANNGTAFSFTGDALTTDVALNVIGASPAGSWGAKHTQNTSADLATITTGFTWTTAGASVIVSAIFK